MKKTISFLLLMCIFFSCKKENITESNQQLVSGVSIENTQADGNPDTLTLLPEHFNFIGEAHNEGLEYVFNNTFAVNPQTTADDVLNASVEYIFDVNEYTTETPDNREDLFTENSKLAIKNAALSNSIIYDSTFLKGKLSTLQYAYMKQLETLMSAPSNELNIDETIASIGTLEYEALEELNDDEIVYVLSVTNLAKHSLMYWQEEGDKWLDQLNNNSGTSYAATIDWKDIAETDVGAFMVGFPFGIKVGVIVGGLAAGIASGGVAAGVGAVLGGIAGGTVTGLGAAIAASSLALASKMVVNFFSDWF